MLLQRIITASILASLIVSAVMFLPAVYFSLVIGVLVLIGAWEWTFLISLEKLTTRVLFLVSLTLPMIGITFWTQFLEIIALFFEWPGVREYSGLIEWTVIPPILFWVIVMILIRQVPTLFLKLELKTCYRALTGWFVLLAAWMFLGRLHLLYGSEMVLYFMILIWIADISAYFTGKKFGKDKLSPDISPGKTLQGMYGALGSAAICAIVLSLIYSFSWMSSIDFILLSVLTVLISIYGDLFFSLIKRQKGVKDSGIIFPGHGGVLDRIDSIIAASPFFYAGVALIGMGVFQ
ncbi:MAG: phosphatidate cytidylyltransferase [Methylococcaceae bacterium]|nr:phosphatidate cytidylyltransferase [Methylococcaceae bacterium]